MKVGVVLMTALVPTIGHQALVRFASNFMGNDGDVIVIIPTRSKEPTEFWQREEPFEYEAYPYENVLCREFSCDEAPQNPPNENVEGFWKFWIDSIKDLIPEYAEQAEIILFGSELYGKEICDRARWEWIPYDLNRKSFPFSGTQIRQNLFARSNLIAPEFRQRLKRNIVFFGQESVGKSSGVELLHQMMLHPSYAKPSTVVDEWARPYLENQDVVLDDESIMRILRAQIASEKAAFDTTDNLIIIKDTDSLSTYGYMKIMQADGRLKEPEKTLQQAKEMIQWHVGNTDGKADDTIYIAMKDNVPFVEDRLRLGGDKRESTYQFWLDILAEFNFKGKQVIESDGQENIADRIRWIYFNVKDSFLFEDHRKISAFVRD